MYKIDITIVEDDMGVNFLISKVFAKLHTLQSNHNFAISFKNYTPKSLGNVISVIAKEEVLQDLKLKKVLRNYEDYLHISRPKPAKNVTYFRKVNSGKGVERLKRRCIKRKAVSIDEAEKRYEGYKQKHSKLPYVLVNSSSTGQKFSLFVEPCTDTGNYNSYGLCV